MEAKTKKTLIIVSAISLLAIGGIALGIVLKKRNKAKKEETHVLPPADSNNNNTSNTNKGNNKQTTTTATTTTTNNSVVLNSIESYGKDHLVHKGTKYILTKDQIINLQNSIMNSSAEAKTEMVKAGGADGIIGKTTAKWLDMYAQKFPSMFTALLKSTLKK